MSLLLLFNQSSGETWGNRGIAKARDDTTIKAKTRVTIKPKTAVFKDNKNG